MNNTILECKEGDPKYPYLYRGLVMDNNDPLQYGRLKIKIYPMFRLLETQYLPWVKPAFPVFDGAGSGTGSFAVPKNGTYVFVMFEQGDIHQPVYFAESPTAQKGLPSSRTTNYPNKKVWRTSANVEVSIDDTAQEIKVTHPAGTSITIDSAGKVTVAASGDVAVSGTNVQVDATANAVVNAGVKATIAAPQVNLGDEAGYPLITTKDFLTALVIAPSGGGPCTLLPGAGTLKSKGS